MKKLSLNLVFLAWSLKVERISFVYKKAWTGLVRKQKEAKERRDNKEEERSSRERPEEKEDAPSLPSSTGRGEWDTIHSRVLWISGVFSGRKEQEQLKIVNRYLTKQWNIIRPTKVCTQGPLTRALYVWVWVWRAVYFFHFYSHSSLAGSFLHENQRRKRVSTKRRYE